MDRTPLLCRFFLGSFQKSAVRNGDPVNYQKVGHSPVILATHTNLKNGWIARHAAEALDPGRDCVAFCVEKGAAMPTNLAIDDTLLEEALKIGGRRTKRETVNDALREFIQRRKRLRALDALGTIVMDPVYDYKKARRRR